jgi:copper chaperone CopZ
MNNRENCPTCNRNGRKVNRITLEHLLTPERRDDIHPSQYFVCTAPGCDTVYFAPKSGRTFSKPDLIVRFGLKETDAPHQVCYCFDYTTEEIEDEIRRTGQSTVIESIKANMSGPGCRCEVTNPLGACCLNTVQAAVSSAFRSVTIDEPEIRIHSNQLDPTAAIAAGGSVMAAILSSACCWLPLLLIAFGASAAGVAGVFEAYRPYFVIAAVALLGVGFYTVYIRKERCAPCSACATPNRKLRMFSQTMLWTATALVTAFVFFPNYVGYVFGAPPSANVAETANLASDEYHIEGMTCQGCADGLRNELNKLPNVVTAEVDYFKKSAVVRYHTDHPLLPDLVIKTVDSSGFRASARPTIPQ